MPKTSPARVDLAAEVGWVARESLLFADDRSPFRARATAGAPGLVVVAGENASGKSLFVRVLGGRVSGAGAVPVSVSIRERAGDGMRKVFMFGDETEQSTGATSVTVVQSAFERNLDREQGSVLLLDEPELGLSHGYARAFGTYIGQCAGTVPSACAGVVVVTHSRELVSAMVDAFGQDPTFVHLSPAHSSPTHPSLSQWLTTPEERSVDELLSLPQTGLVRRRATYQLLGDHKS